MGAAITSTAIVQQQLLEAIERRQTSKIKRLLKSGASANPVNPFAGGDPDYDDDEFVPVSPLHLAIERECGIPAIRALIKAGADINGCDHNGYTAVMCALGRYRNTKYLDLLIELGADVNKPNAVRGESALYWAAWLRKKDDFALTLLAAGADPNAPGVHHESPLHRAVAHGRGIVAAALLGWGADVNAVDHNRNTPLHAAVAAEDVAMIRLLVAAGADINSKNNQGYSPLRLTAHKPELRSCIQDAAREHKRQEQARMLEAAIYGGPPAGMPGAPRRPVPGRESVGAPINRDSGPDAPSLG